MAASGAHLLLCLVCRLAGPPAMPHFTLEKKLKHPHHFQQTDAGNMGLRWESVVAAALAAAMCATIHREKTNVSPNSLTEKKVLVSETCITSAFFVVPVPGALLFVVAEWYQAVVVASMRCQRMEVSVWLFNFFFCVFLYVKTR